jgi:hypothetical protein
MNWFILAAPHLMRNKKMVRSRRIAQNDCLCLHFA